MGTIRELQKQHQLWADHNFPNQPPVEPLLGLVEEVGELSHARLKMVQGIRGMADGNAFREAERDAVGDIFVYLMSYCNASGLDLEAVVDDVWGTVRKRDWRANPQDGEA